ncbi:hypothetical protein EON64_06810 [archaeon]|nr:MAG: hypothetical protein EON64_06810 [archaeon]
MQHEDVEESVATLRCRRPHERHLLLLPHAIQSLVAHGAQHVEGDEGVALFQQHRHHLDLVHTFALAHVIDEIRDRQQVQSRECVSLAAFLRGIVMVAMDGEDGQADALEGIGVIHLP